MTTDWQRLHRHGKCLVATLLAATAVALLQGCGGGGEEEKKKEVVLDEHIMTYLNMKPEEAILYMVCIETVDLSVEKIRNFTHHKLNKECHEITDNIENLPEGKHIVEKKCKKYGLRYMQKAVAEAQPPLRMNCTAWGKTQISNKLSNSSAPQLKDILQVSTECFEDFEKGHPESVQFAQTIFDTQVEKAREDTQALIIKLKKAARETMKKQLAEMDEEDESEEKFDLAASTAKDIAVPAVNDGFFRAAAACFGLAAIAGSAALLVKRRTRGHSHVSRFTGEPHTSDESGDEELAMHTLAHPLPNIRMAE